MSLPVDAVCGSVLFAGLGVLHHEFFGDELITGSQAPTTSATSGSNHSLSIRCFKSAPTDSVPLCARSLRTMSRFLRLTSHTAAPCPSPTRRPRRTLRMSLSTSDRTATWCSTRCGRASCSTLWQSSSRRHSNAAKSSAGSGRAGGRLQGLRAGGAGSTEEPGYRRPLAHRDFNGVRAGRTARVQRTARVWGEPWHVSGLARTLRNLLFKNRNDNNFQYNDWLYGRDGEGVPPVTPKRVSVACATKLAPPDCCGRRRDQPPSSAFVRLPAHGQSADTWQKPLPKMGCGPCPNPWAPDWGLLPSNCLGVMKALKGRRFPIPRRQEFFDHPQRLWSTTLARPYRPR